PVDRLDSPRLRTLSRAIAGDGRQRPYRREQRGVRAVVSAVMRDEIGVRASDLVDGAGERVERRTCEIAGIQQAELSELKEHGERERVLGLFLCRYRFTGARRIRLPGAGE